MSKAIPNRPSNLRVERLAQGLRQTDLARRAKLSLRTINGIESGKGCRQDTKRCIMRALGIPWELREKVFPK